MLRLRLVALCLLIAACAPVMTPTPTLIPTTQTNVDVEMEAAFQEARDTLDIFIDRTQTPHPDRTIVAVKVRFYPPEAVPQDIWVDGVTYQDGVLRGHIGDDIPSLRLTFGKPIVIPTKDILDWMIVEDGKLIGGYTIRLAYSRMSPDEKKRFLDSLDYSIDN